MITVVTFLVKFSSWLIFPGLLIALVGYVTYDMEKSKISRVAAILGTIMFTSSTFSYIYATLEENPRVNIQVSPITGSFTQGDRLDFNISIRNKGKLPISSTTIAIPFSDDVVIDYLNASHPLIPEESAIIRIAQIRIYKLDVIIDPGKTIDLVLPLQITGFGNLEGTLRLQFCSGSYCEVKKTINVNSSVENLSWVVERKIP